jgi:hypothetical protein
MTTTKGNSLWESFIRNEYGQGYTHVMHNVEKYYSWKAILGTIVSSFVVIVVYKVVSPVTQSLLFGIVTGMAAALTFRPLTKRWRYTEIAREDYPQIFKDTPVPYTPQYMDEPTTIHNKRIDGQ